MKKKWLFIGGGIVACVLVIICVIFLNKTSQESTNNTNNTNSTNTNSENNTISDNLEFTAPVLEWWDLYNPNGFDTITAVIRNDNDASIDVSYDLVYYKDKKEIARSEGFSNFNILPKHKDIVWANFNIPKAGDVDEIRMENVVVTKSYYGAIDGKYEYLGTTDGEARFKFEFEKKPKLANISFVLYSDKNGDKKCGKGEIIVVMTDSIMEQVGEVSFDVEGYDFTDYEVYFTAQERQIGIC